MRNILLSLLVIVYILSSCCMSCKENNAPTYRMDQDYKDYVLFPVGSYWVYARTNSQEIDSCYLYRQEISIDDTQRKHAYNFERFEQNVVSSFFADTLFGAGQPRKFQGEVFFYYAERYISNFLVTNLQFFNKIPVGTTLDFADDSKLKYVEQIPSYTLEGQTYSNVKVFENLIGSDERLPKKIYYVSKVGVIRKELFNGQVWNLKRFFIKQ